jgi:hypothetical protein
MRLENELELILNEFAGSYLYIGRICLERLNNIKKNTEEEHVAWIDMETQDILNPN